MPTQRVERVGLGAQCARDRQVASLGAFLIEPPAPGRAAAARALSSVGLRADDATVDDLCSQVWLDVFQRISARPLDEQDGRDAVAAYASRALRNAAVDLVRRGSPARLEVLVDGRDGPFWDESPEGSDDIGDDPDGAPSVPVPASLRPLLGARLREPGGSKAPWPTAAALAAIVLVEHDDLDPAEGISAPEPRSPAAAAGPLWAGLGYAGRTDCFDRPETGAVRQRRSVALRRVAALLGACLGQAVDDGPADPRLRR